MPCACSHVPELNIIISLNEAYFEPTEFAAILDEVKVVLFAQELGG